MRTFLILSITLLLFSNCTKVVEKVTLVELGNITVKKAKKRNITLTADAVFKNPNNLSGKLSIDDVHIYVDDIDSGIITSREFDVPKKGEFTIPLEAKISRSSIFKSNKEKLLNAVLKVIQNDSIKIQYKGEIRYHLGRTSYPFTIDKTQNILF